MAYLLNLLYLTLLLAAAPWLLISALRKGKYRQGYAAKLWGAVPRRTSDRPCIWFHAVSVGEVNLLAPILARLQQECPGMECVISTTTHTGLAVAKARYGEHLVFYCPLDFSWAVARAVRRIRPDLLVLAELELWPNLIDAVHQRGGRIAVINGRLSERSWRGYRRVRPIIRRLLRQLDLIAVQSPQYAERFRQLGALPAAVVVTGNVKFDGVQTERTNPRSRQLAQLARVQASDIIFLAGSTQAPEEELALQAFLHLAPAYPQLRLILVPRHPERFDVVSQLLDRSGVPWDRRSQLQTTRPATTRVLLVDTVGELSAWWGLAHLAFVGGSMGSRGGQNMMEPAGYGAAIAFGPHTHNFRDIVSILQQADAALVVHDGAQLTAFLQHCLQNPEDAAARGQAAQQAVLQNQGAAQRTVQLLLERCAPAARRAADTGRARSWRRSA